MDLNTLLTRTERKILKVLQDGLPHTKEELLLSYSDEYGETNGLKAHIGHIRGKIERYGFTVKAVARGRASDYQMFRLLHSPSKD